jgi:serine/threonine protein kinase/Tol biopolymer transport system component
MIGQTISHYTILEKLGEGGMGVVYKARDTKLNRDVALKFLPDRVNSNAAEKARFLQEAQAAAALNHPNICTIHSVEESGASIFMAMEFIEGGTLREKIPFAKPDDAVTTAIQIGEALQEAHSKGIVHRDVKAENVMLTSRGQAKVMDFGLAKLKGSLKLTRTSSTVGTLGYMAPEQIQGGEVDHRSDIFSFGVLFFEMLTGRLPFRGEHEAAMVYSIVNEEPQDIVQLMPGLSPIVVNFVQRCLEKDPADRYQTMQDAVSELRRSQKKTSRVSRTHPVDRTVVPPPGSHEMEARVPGPPAKTPGPRSRALLYVSIAAGIVVIAAGVFLLTRSSVPELDPAMTFRTIQMPFTVFQYPGLSGDGKYIVFPAADPQGKWDLYWMHNAGGDARRVTFDSAPAPPRRWLSADISPDGSQIIYNRTPKGGGIPELCVVSSNGGVGRKILDRALAAYWSPDGSRIGYFGLDDQNRRAVFSIKPDGTDRRVEFADTAFNGGNFAFSWSPDGRSIAWIRNFPDRTSELITVDLRTGEEKQLTHDGKNLDEVCWTSRGMIVFSSSRSGNTNIWAVPEDGGEEVQITKGAGPDLGVNVSNDGNKLLYYQNQDIGNIWTTNGEGSNLRQLTSDDQNITSLCVSPDGRTIVYSMASEQGFVSTQSHLYVMDADGRRQLTFGNEVADYPLFSPDGKHVSFRARRPLEPDDSIKIYVLDFAGGSAPRALCPGRDARWTDEDDIAVWDPPRSYLVKIAGGTPEQLLQDSIVAIPLGDGRYTVVRDTRRRPNWSILDGKTGKSRPLSETPGYFNVLPAYKVAYQLSPEGVLQRISLPDGASKALPGSFPGLTGARLMSVTADGNHIVFINRQSRGKLVMIDNLFK